MTEISEISQNNTVSPSSAEYEGKAYKRSRSAYTYECMFEYMISILASGQFLTVLLKHLGVPDSLNGIIQSIISLAFLFQFFSVFILHRINNTKRFVIIFHNTSQLFFVTLYLIPFFPFAAEAKHILAVICPLVAYFGNYFVTSIIYRWGNSFVEPHHRGRFGAKKEMISLITGIVLILMMGFTIDAFENSNNVEGGFILLAISVLLFCLSDLVCLLLIKNDKKTPEQKKEAKKNHLPLKEIMHGTFGNKYFRTTVISASIWKAAVYVTVGFMGTYMDNSHELNFSVGTVQVIILASMFMRFLIARPIGKYADKTSYASGYRVGMTICAIGFFINIFTSPDNFTRYFVILFYALYNGGLAGIDANILNLPYNYVEEKYFIHASAIKNSISGLCGFLASLLAGALLGHIQDSGNVFLGMNVHGQQVLSCISFILAAIAIAYTKLVIEKQKKLYL